MGKRRIVWNIPQGREVTLNSDVDVEANADFEYRYFDDDSVDDEQQHVVTSDDVAEPTVEQPQPPQQKKTGWFPKRKK